MLKYKSLNMNTRFTLTRRIMSASFLCVKIVTTVGVYNLQFRRDAFYEVYIRRQYLISV